MASTQSPRGDVSSMQDRAKIKRRSLRKGTHSCWECKRRKMRCVADPNNNVHGTTCQGCRRRGTACISQEIPEELAMRISNTGCSENSLESALELHASAVEVGESTNPASTERPANDPLTPASTVSRPSKAPSAAPIVELEGSYVLAPDRSLEGISQHLHAALPSLDDTRKINHARALPGVPAHELMTLPYTTLSQNVPSTAPSLVDAVDPRWHPVLIARHMLMLATSLQHLHPDVHSEVRGLSETPQVMSERMARVANHYVTSKDEMLGSIEALECVLIESVYQANLGNLRQSWIIARRAVSIAQLMGIDQPDRHARYQVFDTSRLHDPQIIWQRIVFLDRFLCVMLSLPAACPDPPWTPDTALSSDNASGHRLERIHCMVASRILDSNGAWSAVLDRQGLNELDSELQKTARSLPARWWLIPRLDASRTDPRTMFWNTGRIFAQVLHYNLVYRLHLPYMFRSTVADRTYEYSRITCVSASREILTRFLALRSFNGIASSCRIIEFIALMASLTLLLAHLHSQAFVTENFLAHQYHSDRAIIEQVQESMEEIDQLKADPLSARSADLLRRLMIIDIYEGDGFPRPAQSVSVHPEANDVDDEHSVCVRIPYFGLIKIARDARLNLNFHHSEVCLRSPLTANISPSAPIPDIEVPVHQIEPLVAASTGLPDGSRIAQHEMYPGLTAGMEDWVFQGVDLALFDTVLQSAANEVRPE